MPETAAKPEPPNHLLLVDDLYRYSEPHPSGFRACFVLEFLFQRGGGRRGRGCKFQNKSHETAMAEGQKNGVYRLAVYLLDLRLCAIKVGS